MGRSRNFGGKMGPTRGTRSPEVHRLITVRRPSSLTFHSHRVTLLKELRFAAEVQQSNMEDS